MIRTRGNLPPFIGGQSYGHSLALLEDDGPADLTGREITAEVHWEGCCNLLLEEGDGITVIDLSPEETSAGEEPSPHITVELSTEDTDDIPEGRNAYLIIAATLEADDTDVKKFGPFFLERLA